MSQAHLGLERFQDSLEQAEAAIGLEPTEEWGHRLRAFALLDLGRPKDALAAAREAVRLKPYRAESHSVLGEAQLACRDSDGAEATARRLVELAPSDVTGHDLLGRVCLTGGRYRDAEEHFREALRVDPENSAVLNNIGVALKGQGRRREAVHLFAQASAADPRDSTARRNATSAARVGVVGLVLLQLLRVPATAWRQLWPPDVIAVLVIVLVVGASTAGYLAWRRRQRRHRYPDASPELMRSLRRQSTWRDWFPRRKAGDLWISHLPMRVLVVGAVAGFLLAAMGAGGLVDTSADDTTPGYVWLTVLAGGLAAGGYCVLRIRCRWRG
jgi:Flp pilus assembly protein TadD